MNVFEAIKAVKQELGPFAKGLEVDDLAAERTYNVISFDEMTRRIQPIELKHGVTVIPQVTESSSWDGEAAGVPSHFSKVTVTYLISGPDGSTVEASMVGESESKNCKSMSAAISFARKSLYKELYQIVVGDPDPDAVGTTVVATAGARPASAQTAQSRPQQQAQQPAYQPPPQQQQTFAPQAPPQTFAAKVNSTAGPTAADGTKMSSVAQQQTIWAIVHKVLNWDDPKMFDYVEHTCNQRVDKLDQLTSSAASNVIKALKILERQAKGGQ